MLRQILNQKALLASFKQKTCPLGKLKKNLILDEIKTKNNESFSNKVFFGAVLFAPWMNQSLLLSNPLGPVLHLM